jgi:hypothetical protein
MKRIVKGVGDQMPPTLLGGIKVVSLTLSD